MSDVQPSSLSPAHSVIMANILNLPKQSLLFHKLPERDHELDLLIHENAGVSCTELGGALKAPHSINSFRISDFTLDFDPFLIDFYAG